MNLPKENDDKMGEIKTCGQNYPVHSLFSVIEKMYYSVLQCLLKYNSSE